MKDNWSDMDTPGSKKSGIGYFFNAVYKIDRNSCIIYFAIEGKENEAIGISYGKEENIDDEDTRNRLFAEYLKQK